MRSFGTRAPALFFVVADLLLLIAIYLVGEKPNDSDFSARASHCSQEQVRAKCAIDKGKDWWSVAESNC